MTNPYHRLDSTAPFGKGVAVVPSDATVLPQTDALWVGGTGALTLTMADGNDAVFTAVPAGTRLDYAVTKVKAATTATLIVALYRNY